MMCSRPRARCAALKLISRNVIGTIGLKEIRASSNALPVEWNIRLSSQRQSLILSTRRGNCRVLVPSSDMVGRLNNNQNLYDGGERARAAATVAPLIRALFETTSLLRMFRSSQRYTRNSFRSFSKDLSRCRPSGRPDARPVLSVVGVVALNLLSSTPIEVDSMTTSEDLPGAGATIWHHRGMEHCM